MTSRPPDRSPDALGDRGEDLAAAHLRALGYRIVERRLRTRHGEIDLLIRRGRSWAAVEVKTRTDHAAPERCVDPAQRDRIERALLALAPGLRPAPRSLRVDVVAVRAGPGQPPEVRHFEGPARRWPPG